LVLKGRSVPQLENGSPGAASVPPGVVAMAVVEKGLM
jgi:hypothetical protein